MPQRIPRKLSELKNDIGFVTASDITTGEFISTDGFYPVQDMKTYQQWLVDKTGYWRVTFLVAPHEPVIDDLIALSSDINFVSYVYTGVTNSQNISSFAAQVNISPVLQSSNQSSSLKSVTSSSPFIAVSVGLASKENMKSIPSMMELVGTTSILLDTYIKGMVDLYSLPASIELTPIPNIIGQYSTIAATSSKAEVMPEEGQLSEQQPLTSVSTGINETGKVQTIDQLADLHNATSSTTPVINNSSIDSQQPLNVIIPNITEISQNQSLIQLSSNIIIPSNIPLQGKILNATQLESLLVKSSEINMAALISSTWNSTTSLVAPAKVSNVSNIGQTVFWNAVSGCTYNIYYSTGVDPSINTTKITTGSTGLNYRLSGLAENTRYYVWVKAESSGVESTSFSAPINFIFSEGYDVATFDEGWDGWYPIEAQDITRNVGSVTCIAYDDGEYLGGWIVKRFRTSGPGSMKLDGQITFEAICLSGLEPWALKMYGNSPVFNIGITSSWATYTIPSSIGTDLNGELSIQWQSFINYGLRNIRVPVN